MTEKTATTQCISCDRTDLVVPLLALRVAGKDAWICSQCLPALIHEPQKLADRLAGMGPVDPAPDLH